MPSYTYRCDSCDRTTAVTHGMEQRPSVACDVCAQTMRKTIGAVAVVWGGLPPHAEHQIGPAARDLLDENAHQRRVEAHIAKKEARHE